STFLELPPERGPDRAGTHVPRASCGRGAARCAAGIGSPPRTGEAVDGSSGEEARDPREARAPPPFPPAVLRCPGSGPRFVSRQAGRRRKLPAARGVDRAPAVPPLLLESGARAAQLPEVLRHQRPGGPPGG